MNYPANGKLTIRIARTVGEIEEIREIWSDWQSNPSSDIDNYLSMVRSRPEIQCPHVMLVYRNGQLDSILVGRLERKQIRLTLGYLKVFKPEVRVLCFTHGGFLGNQSAENSAFVTREVMKCLRTGEADVARLEHLGVDSSLFQAAKGLPGILCRDHFAPTQIHGCLRLPDSYNAFMSSLSRKERHNLKRYAGRLKADFPGKMRIEHFRREDQVDALIRDAEVVARKTYQRGLGVGFEDSCETRELLRAAARKNTLCASLLYLSDTPCAFMIGVQYRQSLHGISMGYDREFNDYSPGSLLLMEWIRMGYEANSSQHVTEIDLGPGDGRFKRAIYNHMWDESLVYISAPTIKGLTFNFQRTVTYLIESSAKKMLQKTGSLDKIKKLWRSRAYDTRHMASSRDVQTDSYSEPAAPPHQIRTP